MKSAPQTRIQSRLLRAFVLQLVLISLVTIIGVLAAFFIVERILVNRALQGEADYYWGQRLDRADIPLPDTLNLSAFSSSDPRYAPPPEYQAFDTGQHRISHDGQSRIVHISEVDGERLYLLFEESTVSDLAFYFGVLPLLLVLLFMYAFAYMTYYLAKQAISPLSRLANSIENFNFGAQDTKELDLYNLSQSSTSETRILADAIQQFVNRSHASIERERNFTRYASHELRTPLAVIQGSVSSLELLELEGAPARAIERIKRTCKSMADLLGTLLLLAREQQELEEHINTDVHALLKTLVNQINEVRTDNSVEIRLNCNASLLVNAPESVLSIVLGNLLSNAVSYTNAGVITLDISSNSVVVSDTGIGMNDTVLNRMFEPFYRAEDKGSEHQGMGMAIVHQTCKRYQWQLEVDSSPGVGTRATLFFTVQ
ncbi:MAG: signal transduction histidine kinase [Granulosicoccus sp.]|jgi:signal transduction histidine kinase